MTAALAASTALTPVVQFYPYQRRWLDDKSRFKIGMWSRQVGKTFSTAAEVVDDCVVAEMDGRRERWVILSRGERQAAEFVDEGVKPLVKAYFTVYSALANVRYEEGEWKAPGADGATYKMREVIFPGGSRITALPANPDTARGFSANVVLDEFALHKDSREIWAAVFPIVSRAGLKMRVISTPKGKGNKFYELITGDDHIWSRHIVDIHKAVTEGCPRDIEELRAAINDEDIWAQEFELQFLDEASAWLPYDLISTVEHRNAGDPENYTGQPCYLGNDIAAKGHLWVTWVWEPVGDVLWTREIKILRRATFAEQDAVMDELFMRYKVARLCMDQTGMGMKPVEDAQSRYGEYRVEGVMFNPAIKLYMATQAKERFEDRSCRIPMGDTELRADLHSLKKTVSAAGAARFVVDGETDGHGDRAWAAFLGIYAADQIESSWRPL